MSELVNPTDHASKAPPEPEKRVEQASAAQDTAARLGGPAAYLLAWVGLTVVNAAGIATLSLPAGGLRVRALHHAYDAGHSVALGLVGLAAVALFQRFGPRRPRADAVRGLFRW